SQTQSRRLFSLWTYAGVADTGPVAGETFEQKVARLKAVSAAAKQRAEEGGDTTAPTGVVEPDALIVSEVLESAMTPPAETVAAAPAAAPSASTGEHKPTGN